MNLLCLILGLLIGAALGTSATMSFVLRRHRRALDRLIHDVADDRRRDEFDQFMSRVRRQLAERN